MAGFFSLGGKEQDPQTEININNNNNTNSSSNNNSFLLFKNQEIYNKGFELWQQYYQLHHHHQQRHDADVVDFSIGPSRRSNDVVVSSSGDESYRSGPGLRAVRQGRGGGGDGINCQDCGNQAKKDCVHLRCRTCCKSRGFDCQTHVKSTWVPAAKRRERLQQQQLAVRGENPKRIREDHGGGGGGSALACSAAAGFELGNFPAEVNSPAVFRCVRVSAVDDAAEHYAYQTAVNIAGHVFKGILYDQGRYGGGESPSGSHQQQQQQPLDLIAAAAAATSSAAATSNAHMTMLESSAYPTPLNAFMAGTQFFPPPRS